MPKKFFDKDGNAISELNELEFVDGRIFANVYLTTKIVELDLEKDKLVRTFDFSKLVEIANDVSTIVFNRKIAYDECLNGIAFDKESNTFWLTGKNWSIVFEVSLDVGK